MKRIYLSLVTIGLALSVQAQNANSIQAKAEVKADNCVDVAFAIDENDYAVGNNEILILRTAIKSANGKSCDLEPVYIMGNRRYVMNQRRAKPITGKVIRYKDLKKAPYKYNQKVAFEPWMNGAEVEICQELEGCAGCGKTLSSTQLLTIGNMTTDKGQKNLYKDLKLAYIEPEVEQVKKRSMQTNSQLDFELSKAEIKPEYLNNPRELSKIKEMINNLKNDDGVNIKGIEIIGFASPEGNLDFNKKLAESRANALKKYIQSQCNVPSSDYKVSYGGENWKGLIAAMESDKSDYSKEVLRIINAASDKEIAKTELKQYKAGQLHKILVGNVYPSLRTAICKADYEVKKYSDVSEARRMFETKPQNLSLNEMYLVANSYGKGSEGFNNVIDVAVKMFPTDATANLNAAATALTNGDTTKAEKYLNRVKTRNRIPEADNSWGVLYLLKGDKVKALSCFEAAANAGIKEAKENINVINN